MCLPAPALVATLFGELAELEPPERATRLDAIARDDASLARELRSLLDAEARAGDFLGVVGGARTAATPTLDDRPPAERIGPYRLTRRLGRGGMATVWLARDERLGRPVALKVLDATARARADARDRFLAEARAAAGLDHPHVAIVHDVGETPDGVRYIAMAYCEGGTLADRIARGPIGVADAVSIARQLAEALHAAHARGIVHRDVKPANVLFDATGQVRLADFGIAKLADTDAVITRPGIVLGTVAYLAPEQVRGQGADERTDLWALGVTLYEMLAGRRPFSGDSAAALLHAVLASEPAPPSRHAAGVPGALDALVMRLLRKEPRERPASALDVLRALDGDAGAMSSSAARTATTPPSPLTPLVGRARELALGAELLARSRLVTLTGPGGTGKTRLAIELARRVAGRHADGAFVIELASTARHDLVAPVVAQALGLREVGSERAEELVVRWFADREALLVLDNFEQVIDAAPFVATLLAAAPRLTVLVTSRAPLRLLGEQELPVPPLGLPAATARSVDDVGAADAVRLFVERARASRPEFALDQGNVADVAALCRRLDGLPLAIELAAARARMLSPRALRARLEQRLDVLRSDARDVAPRHRTLRDVIEWSYALLRPEEQALFAELAVFVGGFGLDAADAIARGTPHARAMDVLDRVASLCDKSLLVRREQADGEPRFDMLETVREFGLERLRESGREPEVRAAHRAFFLALAEEGARHLRGPRQVEWTTRLLQEQDNLRAASEGALAADDFDAAVRFGIALHRLWLVAQNHLAEVIERLRELDRRIRDEPALATRVQHAALLTALGLLSGVRSEVRAYDYLRESLQAYREAGDDAGTATALNHVGWYAYLLGEYDQAARDSAAALEMHAAARNDGGVRISLVNLAWVDARRGDLPRAEDRMTEALAIAHRRGDLRSVAYVANCLCAVLLQRGEHARALSLSEEAIRVADATSDKLTSAATHVRRATVLRDTGRLDEAYAELAGQVMPTMRQSSHKRAIAFGLWQLGQVCTDLDRLDEARAALDESLAICTQLRYRTSIAECEAQLAEVERRSGAVGAALARARTALRLRVALGETVATAASLEGVARIAAELGDDAAAVSLVAGASRTRERCGAPLAPVDRAAVDALLDALRARLGDAYETAWAEGCAALPESLVARALSIGS